MAEKSVLFDILARDRASAAFDSVGRSADKLGNTTSQVGAAVKNVMIGAAAAVGAYAIKLGGDAIEAAKESIKVGAQTEAVIRSTGGAAGVTAAQIGDYAHRLQVMSGVSDEAIQSGQNMLLTFTNIKNSVGEGNDVFNQATATLLDMSVALGTDASTSAVQLGKALNDPIAGISALTRVGVTFTDTQKEQIKTMVAAGDTMGAQKLILAELNREFGGSAKAQGDAMTSGERLSMKWGDLQEQIGMWLIPKMNALIDGLSSAAEWFDRNRAVAVPLVAVLGTLAAAVIAVNTAAKIYTAVQAALNIVLLANPVGLVVFAIAALAAGLVIAYKNSETFRDIVQVAFAVVAGYAQTAGSAIGAIVGVIESVIRAARRMADALSNLPGVGAIGNIVGKIPGFDTGGVVPGPRGAPRLIMAHGGETVLPTHKTGNTSVVAADNSEVVGRLDMLIRMVERQTDTQVRMTRTY